MSGCWTRCSPSSGMKSSRTPRPRLWSRWASRPSSGSPPCSMTRARIFASMPSSRSDIGVAECVDLLIEATKDEEWEVRLAAIAALDKIGDARGKPAIKALMKDPDFVVQMRAERIIWDWKKKAKATNEARTRRRAKSARERRDL